MLKPGGPGTGTSIVGTAQTVKASTSRNGKDFNMTVRNECTGPRANQFNVSNSYSVKLPIYSEPNVHSCPTKNTRIVPLVHLSSVKSA